MGWLSQEGIVDPHSSPGGPRWLGDTQACIPVSTTTINKYAMGRWERALHGREMGEKKKQSGSCAMERDETGDT